MSPVVAVHLVESPSMLRVSAARKFLFRQESGDKNSQVCIFRRKSEAQKGNGHPD